MLLGLCAVTLFVGCQKEMEDQPTPATKSVTLEISVSAEESVRTTPTNMENAINSVRIYAFLNGKRVGYLYREAAAADGAIYMDMNLPEIGTHDVEFYLIANEAEMADDNNSVVTLAENMTKAQLEAVKFTGLRKGESLPMYEKRVEAINVDAIAGTANTATGHEDHSLLSQKINFSLLRPIAKLSLYGAKVSGMSSDPQILAEENTYLDVVVALECRQIDVVILYLLTLPQRVLDAEYACITAARGNIPRRRTNCHL